MTHLQRILSYTKHYWKRLALSGTTAIFFGIFSAAPTYIIQHIVDKVFVQRHINLLIPFFLGFVSLYAMKGIFMYLSNYYMNWVGNKVVNDIRYDLFKKIVYFPISFFQKKTTGELMSHFLSDITIVQNASSAAVRNGIRSFFEAICLISVAFIQNFKLAIFLIFVGPAIGFTIKKMGKKMRSTTSKSQERMSNISSLLQEMFIGIREIKSFNTENVEVNRFSNYLKNYFGCVMKNVQATSITPAIVEIIAMGGCGMIFYIAAHQVISGSITPGQLTSFFAATILAYQPLKRLINVYADIQSGTAAAGRVFDVIDLNYPTMQNRNIQIPSFNNSIVFKNMSFSHLQNYPIFKNINLEIKKGDSLGIIGPSGSGKSTFCDLLLGFINPTSGNIYIDQQDITKLTLKTLRNQIGYVGQKTFLFNDTVFNNVAYAKQGATKKEVFLACQKAHAHEFIDELPEKYQTIVGEDGTLLSGGQKQRLTIARAMLKNPEILIFDEATSSLDQKSENIIRLTLQEICKQKTVIVISHRLSLVEKMDKVLLVQDGQIVETNKNIKIPNEVGINNTFQI